MNGPVSRLSSCSLREETMYAIFALGTYVSGLAFATFLGIVKPAEEGCRIKNALTFGLLWPLWLLVVLVLALGFTGILLWSLVFDR
jgi:hypothetical protein